jgi:hypothetical protein
MIAKPTAVTGLRRDHCHGRTDRPGTAAGGFAGAAIALVAISGRHRRADAGGWRQVVQDDHQNQYLTRGSSTP